MQQIVKSITLILNSNVTHNNGGGKEDRETPGDTGGPCRNAADITPSSMDTWLPGNKDYISQFPCSSCGLVPSHWPEFSEK